MTRGTGISAGDALADALMGPGGVVMLLIPGQDSAQVRLVQDQGPVAELTAQGADQALADRVHPRRLQSRAHDRGAGGWNTASKERVKFDPRSWIRNRNPRTCRQGPGSVTGLLYRSTCLLVAVTPPMCIRRVPCPVNTST